MDQHVETDVTFDAEAERGGIQRGHFDERER